MSTYIEKFISRIGTRSYCSFFVFYSLISYLKELTPNSVTTRYFKKEFDISRNVPVSITDQVFACQGDQKILDWGIKEDFTNFWSIKREFLYLKSWEQKISKTEITSQKLIFFQTTLIILDQCGTTTCSQYSCPPTSFLGLIDVWAYYQDYTPSQYIDPCQIYEKLI